MASEEKRKLLAAISPTLKSAGFRKRDATWRREQNGFIQIFNVQGSQWSKSFYLNLGVYITSLGDNPTPLEYDAHIRNRVDNLILDRQHYGQLLDLESDIDEEVRYSELVSVVSEQAIPWLNRFSDSQRIIEWLTGEQPHGLPIRHTVYDHYGITRRNQTTKG